METTKVTKIIAAHLKTRSGKQWSVTKGRGTACGWITISSPPARLNDCGYMTDDDRRELADLLGMETPVHHQGETVADSNAHYTEYLNRAAGLTPSVIGQQYWD